MAVSKETEVKKFFRRRGPPSFLTPFQERRDHVEFWTHGENSLMRSYSYIKTFKKDNAGETLEIAQILVSRLRRVKKRMLNQETRSSCETIKTSGSSMPAIKNWTSNMLCFVVLPLVVSTAFIYFLIQMCDYPLYLNQLSRDLTENLFGQEEVIDRVYHVLKQCTESTDFHPIIFTGNVGVGKTLTSSIISQNFPEWACSKLIFKLTDEDDITKKLSFSLCGFYLIRVDDLKPEDVDLAVNLILNIKTKMKSKKVILLLIFSTNSDNEKNYVISKFRTSYIPIAPIHFKPLGKDVVEKCYLAEMIKQGVKISNADFAQLVFNKMKYNDVVKGPVGCKGVADDVSFYVKQR